jgi:hypothetical protein
VPAYWAFKTVEAKHRPQGAYPSDLALETGRERCFFFPKYSQPSLWYKRSDGETYTIDSEDEADGLDGLRSRSDGIKGKGRLVLS